MFLQEKQSELNEVWKDIPGYEGLYMVSSLGNVFAYPREGLHKCRWGEAKMRFPGGIKKQTATKFRYRYVALRRPGGKGIKFLVHRLVMLAFVGVPDEKTQVNHKDGNPANNTLENLEYCTSRQNLMHCINVLKKKRGESMQSKLKEVDIPKIRNDTRSLTSIAKEYGVSIQAISMVKKRKNWKHVE